MTHTQTRENHIGWRTPESEYFAVCTQMLSIPRDPEIIGKVDAIVAWPGIVLERATTQAIKVYNAGNGRHLLVAGYHVPEVAEDRFTLDGLTGLGMVRTDGVHTQVHANHAGQQANWVAEKVKWLGIKNFALYVPAFHLPRAMLTIIESLRRLDLLIPIIPVPTVMSPFEPCVLDSKTGERNLSQMDVIHGEVNLRMMKYQRPNDNGTPGDVLTTPLWEDYLQWLYEQPLLKSVI